ncbi:MAG: hypothetical protein GX345_05270 [Clostridiales bacterium]|nr:hypothetical protein [Clostridiales bacterium]
MKKKFTSVLSLFLVFSLLLGISSFAGDTASPPYKAHLAFKPDGKFKILQVADIQEGPIMVQIVKDFLRDIVPATAPDLIVLTGDNFGGYYADSGVEFIDRILVKKSIDNYMSIFEAYGIPVAMVYGNHDAETSIGKREQMEIYNSYSCSISHEEVHSDKGDYGTYNIPIYESKKSDKIAFNIWMIDSNMYDEVNGGYDHVYDEQIEWYINKSNALKEENGGVPVPSLLFQHIIVPEIFDALSEVPDDTPGAIRKNNKAYILNPENTKGGVLHEGPCPPTYNNGQFDAVLGQGDVLAMAFGHDHVNSFIVEHKGIDLIATPGINFTSYGDRGRGVRLFTLDISDLSSYEQELITYDDLYDNEVDALRFTMYGIENGIPKMILAAVQYIFRKYLYLFASPKLR